MKKKMSCLLLAGAVTAGLMGCGTEGITDSSVNLASSYRKTEGAAEVSGNGQSAEGNGICSADFETAYADFAVKLFCNTAKPGENSMVSPLSVWMALTMVENGAAGDTLSEMEQTLGAGTIEEQNKALLAFSDSLSDTEKGRLNLANSIWCKSGDDAFHVNEAFLEKNAESFDADIYSAPFDGQTLRDINNWVKKETGGMVPKILEEINPDTVMCLINAVAFEAEWEVTYEKEAVQTREFTRGNGEKEQAHLMYSGEYLYLEDADTVGFIKPYADGYSFAALLPKEGIALEDYLAGLSGEKYLTLVKNPGTDFEVSAAIPKFTSEYATDLREVLSGMGMPLAFDELKADFSGLGSYEGRNLYIDYVLHKTYVSVDELGTKAGAATAVGINRCTEAAPAERKQVVLDRPFVYAIVDNQTMLPVFIGAVERIN